MLGFYNDTVILAPFVMLLTAAAFLTPFRLRKPSLRVGPVQDDDEAERLAETK